MSMSDPLADMLTRIRNAANAKFPSVDVPLSTLKVNVARVLKNRDSLPIIMSLMKARKAP